MNFFLFGYFGAGNLGDEAILHACVQWCREQFPGAEFRVLSSRPEETKREGFEAVGRGDASGIVKAIRWADAVIAPGGGVFQDATSARSVGYYWGITRLAGLFGKPVFLLSQGVGPLRSGVARRLTRCAFRRAVFVSVRDSASRKLLEDIGIARDRIADAGDAVLALSTTPSQPEAEEIVLGISLREHTSLAAVETTLTEALVRIGEEAGQPVRLRLLPFQTPQDTAVSERFATRCAGVRGIKIERISHEARSIPEMLNALSGVRVMVGMRLHSLVLAALRDIPFVGLAYDPKVQSFAEICAMPVAKSKAATADELADGILGLVRAPKAPRERMRIALETGRRRLRDTLDEAGAIVRTHEQGRIVSLGCPVSTRTFDETVEEIITAVRERRKLHIVTVNPEMIMLGRKNREFRRILTLRSGMNTADGVGVRLGVRAKYGMKIEKVTGFDLTQRLAAVSAETGIKMFLLGTRPEVIEDCARRMSEKTPKPFVVGYHHGFLKEISEDKLVALINKTAPDVVLVGMGSPLQEHWIDRNRDRVTAPVFIGVGGTFDAMAGVVKHAPVLYQKLGIEWLYRLVTQPERTRRILGALPFYGMLALIEGTLHRLGRR